MEEGKFAELVSADTQRYEKELERAVAKFEKEKKTRNLRVLIIGGPSSSGKTTTSKKLCKYLGNKGFQFKLLQVDNYFFSTAEYPRDWFGDMDYELPESIDLMRFNEDLGRLMAGKKIYPPEYDFKTGSRHESKTAFELGKEQILLLDCLHGLYPPTTLAIPDEYKFKTYIETYPAIQDQNGQDVKFTDIRLLRRMCRDVRERGYSVQYTLEHWATVRQGEFKGIIPFFGIADAIINGDLVYGLPVLKYYLLHHCTSPFDEKVLLEYKERGRMDVYRRGWRVKRLIEEIKEPTEKEIQAIPEDNLIREFIGAGT
jgi:uridine kinase